MTNLMPMLVGRTTRAAADGAAAENRAPSHHLLAAALTLRLVGLPVAGALPSFEARLGTAERKEELH